MNFKSINEETKGWLPGCKEEEDNIGDRLLDYAFKDTSYCMDPFARCNNIHPTDLESLAQSNSIDEDEGHLPNCCSIASCAIRDRQNKEEFFFKCWWKDNYGQYWQELHLKDKSTGELKIHREQIY